MPRQRIGFLSILALGACADPAPDAPAASHVRVDTAGDTIVVTTLAAAEVRRARLVEELRIGRVEGEEHEIFGSITALALTPAGDVLVYDDQAEALRRYDRNGRYGGTIGGQGAGPGEYRSIAGLTVLQDGRIVVNDFGNGRFNIYAADDVPAETWILPAVIAARRPLYTDGAGRAFLHDRRLVDDETPREEILIRLDERGTALDTIAIPHSDYRAPGLEVRTERRSVGTFLPFAPTADWTVTAAGQLATTLGSTYLIDLQEPGGGILRIVRDIEPVPVSAEEREAEEARVTARLRRAAPDWRWDGPPIPDAKPAIRSLHAGTDTTIWVQRSASGRALPDKERSASSRTWVSEPIIFDVFRNDGRLMRTVEAPPGVQLSPHPMFGREHVWAVVTDENGVDFVARIRIEG